MSWAEVKLRISGDTAQLTNDIDGVIEDIQQMGATAETFHSIIENASNTQLSNLGESLRTQVDLLNKDLEHSQQRLLELINTEGSPQSIDFISNQIKDLNTYIKETENQLKYLDSVQMRQLPASLQRLDNATNRLYASVKKTARRFSIGFILGGFGTLRVAFREAINLSDTARASFSAISRVIGASVLPVIDALVNGLKTAVVWIAGFVKALTGFDMIGKAMTVTNKQTKSMGSNIKKAKKELNGMLAGFDEINNIETSSSDTGGVASGIGDIGDVGMMSQLQDIMDRMNKMDFTWVEKLKTGLSWLKDNWKPVAVGLGILTGVIVALKLASFLGAAGLTGLAVPFVAIALVVGGLVSIVIGIIELFKEGGNQTNAWTMILGGLVAIVGAVALAFGFIPAVITAVVGAIAAAVLWVVKNWDMVKEKTISMITSIGQWFADLWQGIKNGVSSIGDWFSSKWETFKNWIKSGLDNIGNWFKNMWNGAKNAGSTALNFIKNKMTEIRNWFKNQLTNISGFFTNLYSKITSTFKNIGQKVGSMFSNAIRGAINSVLRTAVNIINGFINSLNFAIKLINKIPGVKIDLVSRMSLPSFDVGTNSVPKDMVAKIHKGEAIVPKKFNDEKFFGDTDTVDMSETNSLLEDILETLIRNGGGQDLSDDDIGRLAVKYIKKQQRLRGGLIV